MEINLLESFYGCNDPAIYRTDLRGDDLIKFQLSFSTKLLQSHD